MTNHSIAELEQICRGNLPPPEGFSETICSYLAQDLDVYSPTTRWLMNFIFASLSLIGIVGNLLVITVVFRVRGMKTPTNCYLVSLAVSDTLFFIATAPTELAFLNLPSNEYIFGSVGCAIFTYLPYLAINSSSLSITAFTVERFIGICYPYRARTICTVNRARLIISVIWFFSIIYNSPWLYLASVIDDDQGRFCSFKLDRDNWTYKVMFLGDFFAFYTIPMILNCTIYARIALTLSQCGDRLKHGSKKKKQENGLKLDRAVDTKISGKRVSSGRNQVVKMLALVVVVFATCWLPYRAMVMYNSFAEHRWDPEWYIFFSKTLIFINCAINPILYNLMSARFRAAFHSLLSGSRGFQRLNVAAASPHSGRIPPRSRTMSAFTRTTTPTS